MDGTNHNGVKSVDTVGVEVLATNDPAAMRRERAEAVRSAHDVRLKGIIDRALAGQLSKSEAKAKINEACDEYLLEIKEIFDDE